MEERWRLTGVRRMAWNGDWWRQRGEEGSGGQWRKKKGKTHGRIVGGTLHDGRAKEVHGGRGTGIDLLKG